MILAAIAGVASFLLFFAFAAQGIYAGDSGDLVTAAAQFGIPHPPGYPLHTFLGWLFSHIPLASVAWRVTLLSSLSHAIVVALVYQCTLRLTRAHVPALFAGLVLVGNYLFFLYSVTAEVFGLLDVFVISFLYLAEMITRPKIDTKWLVYGAFVTGLSLSHHHMIVCMVPALLYLAWSHKRLNSYDALFRVKALGAFFFGLVPYMYIPIAARLSSAINWDRPVTWARFLHLITRGDYGTFQSGTSIDGGMYQRVLSVKAYLVFILVDFSWVGVVLFGFGMWFLYVHRRRLFYFLLIALAFVGPLFAFYANFPLAGRFALGTFERFLLPSYVLMAPVLGLGVWQFALTAAAVLKRILPRITLRQFEYIILIVMLIYPATVGYMTIWRFWGMRTDQTAQNLGLDILASAPPSSIILLVHDTPLFVVQYLRYGLSLRPDTTIVHTARLAYADYAEVLRLQLPRVSVFSAPSSRTATLDFIKANREHRPIMSNSVLPLDQGWAWVVHGMLYKLVSTTVPSAHSVDVIESNMALWQSFHDPREGVLSRYKHLMLSNVLDEYAQSAIVFGDMLMKQNKYADAASIYTRAVRYESDGQRYPSVVRLGVARSLLGDCTGALDMFAQAREESEVAQDELLSYEGITWRDCVGDEVQAQELFRAFDDSKKKTETPLEQL